MTKKVFRCYDQRTDALDFSIDYNNQETASLHALANRNERVDMNLLRRVALWKLDRVLDVPDSLIERLRGLATDDSLAVESPETRLLIHDLLQCPGVGMPMASTVLKFLRPDVFPIIDRRAYRAMYGHALRWQGRSVPQVIELYVQYTVDVGRISQAVGRPLSGVDEQLYCFDLRYNGKL